MYEPNEKNVQAVIAEGLAINEVFGVARAWVYLMHNGIPSETVATLLSEAAQQRTPQSRGNRTTEYS